MTEITKFELYLVAVDFVVAHKIKAKALDGWFSELTKAGQTALGADRWS